MNTPPAERAAPHPADELVAAMGRIYRYRMTTTSGGNLSIRDDDGVVWITPSRVDKGNLQREDIVSILPDGTMCGKHPASSEWPFHQQIYRERPDLRAIVHAHPVALVAFSICGQVPETRLLAKARRICGEVGFAPYALPGSTRLGENIAAVFAAGSNCVLLENHGVVVGGSDFPEAFKRFETLEFTAKIILKAKSLGGEVRYLTDAQLDRARNRDGAKVAEMPEFEPGPVSSGERALRRDLCEFVRRGYGQRLLISTEGSFSARIDGESFVITAQDVDRAHVSSGDLVLMRGGQRQAGRLPSKAAPIHEAIYRRYPEIHSIVIATPTNATAFSVGGGHLDVRTIPESYIFLRDLRSVPYDWVYGNGEKIAGAVSPEFPVALLDAGGALVLGRNILDAFDRLEVLESTAEAVINARHLGEVKPMGEAVIQELIEAFLK